MAPKITSKNLSYASNLPPFLARLQAQTSGAASHTDGPDPILANQRRSGKKRSASEEAEDVPLVVDEQGHAVADVQVGKDGEMTENPGDEDRARAEGEDGGKLDSKESKEGGIKSVVAARKKKVGKVVGQATDHPEPKDQRNGETPDAGSGPSSNTKSSNTRKKAKKIKLSFDEEE